MPALFVLFECSDFGKGPNAENSAAENVADVDLADIAAIKAVSSVVAHDEIMVFFHQMQRKIV